MTQRSDIREIRDNRYSGGIVEDVNSAIQMIFDAFENTPLHGEAVRLAKKKAAASLSGEQRDKALVAIEKLGHLMDREHWAKKDRRS